MTLHYHGTPITPQGKLEEMAGRCFCVSFAAPQNVKRCHEIGQSVMLDNGAFSFWRSGKETNWPGYYRWAEPWLDHPTTWAVIPDVIDGGEDANNDLLHRWPFLGKGWAVWHLHESLNRLRKIVYSHGKVCFGSSGQYAVVGAPGWHQRIQEALEAIHSHRPQIHMLRGLSAVKYGYPFYSVDSTDIARNHKTQSRSPVDMATRWDSLQCAPWRKKLSTQRNLLEVM